MDNKKIKASPTTTPINGWLNNAGDTSVDNKIPQNGTVVKGGTANSNQTFGNVQTFSISDESDRGLGISELTIDDLLESELTWADLFADDFEADSLYGGDGVSIDAISEELDTEPENVKILIRREGLGDSYIEDGKTAVMTQERIDRDIENSRAGLHPDYAQRYITRISTKDFIDLTVTQRSMDRATFDSTVEGDSGSKMGDVDYANALKNSKQTPYNNKGNRL